MPEKLSQLFQRHLTRRRFFVANQPVVVAVSTGVDSMTLLDLLLRLPARNRPKIIIAHVNHQLRQQSAVEERFIRQFASEHHLELHVAQWERKTHPATGIEEAGRKFRYRFFAEVMKKTGAKVVMTAHHADDQAETVLMKLVRGDSLPDLAGIAQKRPFASGQLVRPLLPFSKQDLLEYAKNRQLTWFDDATNQSLTITRNRYRHKYLPALKRENSQVTKHLDRFAFDLSDALQVVNLYCQDLAKRLVKTDSDGQGNRLNLVEWQKSSDPVRRTFLWWWLDENGARQITNGQFDQLVALLGNQRRPQSTVKLPHRLVLKKNYQWASLQKSRQIMNDGSHFSKNVVELGAWYPVANGQEVAVLTKQDSQKLPSDAQQQEMWLAPTQFPLQFRPVQTGDRLLLKDGHFQRVQRVLIDQHVPRLQRECQQVLVDSTGIVVWLVGRKFSWFTRVPGYQSTWKQVFLCQKKIKGRA